MANVPNIKLLKIQWNFGNNCNLACSYCHPDLHSSSSPFPDLDKLIPAFDRLHEICQNKDRVEITFLGGEPTYSPALRHIIEKYSQKNFKYCLTSNGYADANWWLTVKDKLASVTLTYHLSQNLDLFIQKAEIVKDCSEILVAVEPNNWDHAIEAYHKLKQFNVSTKLQFLYKNFTRGNSMYLDYTQEQWVYYFNEHGIDTSSEENIEKTIEFKRQNYLNNYYGHMCWAGAEQIVINHYGDVYRGWCFVENLGNIFQEGFCLLTNAKPCPKFQCVNGFDLQATKSQGSWGMA